MSSKPTHRVTLYLDDELIRIYNLVVDPDTEEAWDVWDQVGPKLDPIIEKLEDLDEPLRKLSVDATLP